MTPPATPLGQERARRTSIAAGLIGCADDEVQARVRSMPQRDRQRLTGHIDWVIDYDDHIMDLGQR